MGTGEIILGIISVLAILASPLIALNIQRKLDYKREVQRRRLEIFTTLMTTRADPLSPEHARALNSIDIAFHGRDKLATNVLHHWKIFHNHLSTSGMEQNLWNDKSQEYLVNLLTAMGKCVGYDFDEVHIKRGIYKPQHHVDIENEQASLRKALVDILVKKFPLPVYAVIRQASDKEKEPIDETERRP